MIDKELIQTPSYWNEDYFQSNPFGNNFNDTEQTQSEHPSRITVHHSKQTVALAIIQTRQKERA